MLLSFAIYGALNHWKGPTSQRFNRQLMDLLNLRKKTFSNADWTFSGLEFNNVTTVLNGRVKFIAGWVVNAGYGDCLEREVGATLAREMDGAMKVLLECVYNDRDTTTFDEHFSTVSITLWKALVAYSWRKLFPNTNPNNLGLDNFGKNFNDIVHNHMITFKTSKEFVDYLFSGQKKEQDSIKHIISLLCAGGQRNSAIIGRMKKSFANFIEGELWKSSFVFFYPNGNFSYCGVLASYGTADFRYSRLSMGSKDQLANVYKVSWSKVWGGGAPDPRHYFEEMERLGWECEITMNTLFRHMFTDWLKARLG